jgi:hypothetical protein
MGLAGLVREGNAKEARRSGRFNWEPLRLPLSVMGVLAIAATFSPLVNSHGYDLTSYWLVNIDYANVNDLSGQGPFRYAPVVGLLMLPLRLLPWDALVILWLGLQLAALRYIGGRWFLVLVLFPPVWLDIAYGNINIFLGAVAVAGLRYPALWVFALLTKVTPGVGVLWFLFRREWRQLAIAGGATLGLVALSVVIQEPGLWRDWIVFLQTSSAMPQPLDALTVPLLPRLALAVGLLAYGAPRDWRWAVPIAVTLAMPTLWLVALAPLVGLGRNAEPLDAGVKVRLRDKRALEPDVLKLGLVAPDEPRVHVRVP